MSPESDVSSTPSAPLYQALRAISLGKRLAVTYHGEERIVEVHAVGVSTAGNACMRVYQVVGGAVFGASSGWKMMKFSDLEDAKLLDTDSEGPRPGYSPGDKGMSSILSEIGSEYPVPKE